MARISASKFKVTGSSTGDFDGDAAGTDTGMATLVMSQVRPGTLCAKAIVDAETNTLTISAKWQVSDDGSTWVDMAYAPNNPAVVVLATGTAGADAAVTKSIPAPTQVHGWRFARVALAVGVTTGTTSDTYDVSYRYIAA